MPDSSDYVQRWRQLKDWLREEARGAHEEALRARDDSSYNENSGLADGFRQVLSHMERVEKKVPG
jgi:hypothetical protein